MSRILALEWNDREVRVAVAAATRDGCVVEEAFALPIATAAADGGPDEQELGRQIAQALHARGIRRIETLVAIGRANIELRRLSLPPAPDDELPDLVRLLAQREFNELDEKSRLDFLPDGQSADQPRTVLAAAIGPDLLGHIENALQAAGLKAEHLVLRPGAAASLLTRSQPQRRAELRLLVDLLDDEVDLTMILDGRAVYFRTVRLPGDPLESAEVAAILTGEIRRTMVAAQNELSSRPVETIALCGVGETHAELAAAIAERTGKPTALFDPFAAVHLAPPLRAVRPDRPGRFAPLLGMLLDQADQVRHAIDFLQPRRKPLPRSRRREYILGAAVVLAMAASYLGYQWLTSTQLRNDIRLLAQQSRALDLPLTRAEKAMQAVADISKWSAGDAVWLEELAELCRDLPPSTDVVLTQVICSALPSHGAEIKIEGLASAAAVVDKLEERLRDRLHRVEGKGRSQDASRRAYPWHFLSTILIGEEK